MRSGSPRLRGAIDAYTVGADILPDKGRWLWIAADNIPSRAGRKRMTPELCKSEGFEAKIGPLVPVLDCNGFPPLIVKNVSVSTSGKARSAKSLTKTGRRR
ncbi:MAG TPA: hypothetical protein PKD48_02260 [Sphingopyxis sp.]|nr:hypothetical protein [Sphingopyxis sp.]HMQ18592.1 hypothetical protein [Sphingopyxis sp.]